MSYQFSDTSASKAGLIQICENTLFGDNGYGRITSDAGLLATFTRGINDGLDRVTSLILQSDGRWAFDDTNFTDYPIATANLVTTAGSEQQDYPFAVTHLKVLRVEVKDSTGAWHKLIPFSEKDLYDQSLTDFLSVAGMPKYYDKLANSVFLYPKPLAGAVTASAGLKVYFQRPPSYFTTADTTKVPGFNSLYHKLVALIACRDYSLDKSLDSAKQLAERVAQMEQDMQDNYSMRDKDEKIQLRARPKRYR